MPLNRSQGVTGTWDPVQCPETRVSGLRWHHSSLKWDPIPAVTPGLDAGDRLRTGPRTKPRSWDWSWDRNGPITGRSPGPVPGPVPGLVPRLVPDRSPTGPESTFCAFQKPSLIPITSSCIPRRSPLQEAGTGGRGSADYQVGLSYFEVSTFCFRLQGKPQGKPMPFFFSFLCVFWGRGFPSNKHPHV